MTFMFTRTIPWVALLAVVTLVAAGDPATANLLTLRGAGWATSIACLTCVTAGITVALSGWSAVGAFIWTEGSALVAASCIAVCADAIL
jgi:hypothetical protein